MENYSTIKTLKQGPQGKVLVVRHRQNGDKLFVLKKIECNDDTEAHRARREVMKLTRLSHRHLAVPRDAFVDWDRSDAAIYLCIVSDFYEKGDLDTLLKDKSRNDEALAEVDIRRWFGQILHTLVYLHDNGVAHTNLKPSNIYLTPNMDVCIGDFGIRTVIEDLSRFRSRTRSVVWSLYWSPPEVFEGPHGTRTDVWSLGCILYEIAALKHQRVLESRDKLLKVRLGDDRDFLKSLRGISCENSSEFLKWIPRILTKNYDDRPTIRDVIRLAYPKLCLELVTSKTQKASK